MRRRESRNNGPLSSGRVLIKVAPKDSAKAWALLVRHSPGMALPDRTFLVTPQALESLRRARVRFTVIFRTNAHNVRTARRFFRQLKLELKVELQQEEILIVEREAQTL